MIVGLGGPISAKTLAKLFRIAEVAMKMTTLMRTQANFVAHLATSDCPQHVEGCYWSLWVFLYIGDAAHICCVCKLL